jgi:SAM-dependent methyltransferase
MSSTQSRPRMSSRAAATRLAVSLKRARDYRLRRWYGTDFSDNLVLGDVGLDAPGRERYAPSSWRGTVRALDRLALGPEDVVADLGAGRGLAVMAAARYPVREVIGVELVPELAREAQATVERSAPAVKAAGVRVVCSDVLAWPVPDDLSVAFMFSPFFGEVFRGAMARLLDSLNRHPRPLRLVYMYLCWIR